MIDLTTVAQAALVLFGAVITTVIVPCVKKNTTVQQQKEIMGWVKIAVAAAEQLYKGSDRGEEKKAYVINFLAEHGIRFDVSTIDQLIEAAVLQLHHELYGSERA